LTLNPEGVEIFIDLEGISRKKNPKIAEYHIIAYTVYKVRAQAPKILLEAVNREKVY
jgi:hypothetical protein